jgi:hypothetical protein
MSHAEPSASSNPTNIMLVNTKTAVASPKLSGDEHVEMADIPTGPPPEEDIMQLARLGDIAAIERLFDGGKFDAKYCDEEGITPLHVLTLLLQFKWAS